MKINVYVANLGAYNAGRLIGEWISLPVDEDELDEKIDAILAAVDDDGDVYGEEIAIHDYEAPFNIGEYDSIQRLNEIAQRIEDIDEDDAIVTAIIGEYNGIDEALDVLESHDYMVYDGCNDMSDVAERYLDETGGLDEIPERLRYYFDYEAYGRDMAIEGTFISYGSGYIEITR